MRKAIVFFTVFILLIVGANGICLATDLDTYTNSIGIEFVLIPSGSFMMGRDPLLGQGWDDEIPLHRVTISRSFYLGQYTVTQDQWTAVMGSNPSQYTGGNNPVENVSWDDAQEFIGRLNAMEGHSRYRLPTEAEWEYAARAGATTAYCFGDDVNELSNHAWFYGNSGNATHPVGQKLPNAWGLYDVHGNVCEWVQDWYGEYADNIEIDPNGVSEGSRRVLRGGSWYYDAANCRLAYRLSDLPGNRGSRIGFRLALSAEQSPE